MRRKLSIALAILIVGAAANTAAADELLHIQVPFAFVVNGHTLPAGAYDVRNEDLSEGFVVIETANGKLHETVSTIPEYREPTRDTSSSPTLTFVREDGQYWLSTIWQSRDYGREVLVARPDGSRWGAVTLEKHGHA